ncbi:non-homologous end-joining DNA ligase [Amycolatopsis australiensis]|uniref:DNA ligase (ATP) n=1 Tax=Amycolatopsis australiensis TaxID=546364 RepID=A0A1K1LQ61_9PSEU|nr:non-homologous end-joining DNA ligase [Amycolatopsis australiensis]SFW13018.1 bifunctional non-homologous end joining protein LigD [Amycolatopsis australiensis]
MLATLGMPPSGPGWWTEFKWDGVRAVAAVAGGRLEVFSRRQTPITSTYPELADLPELLNGRDAVLDGEIVALEDGRPRFGLLQRRMHVQRPSRALLAAVPAFLYVFDVLALDGESTTALPYHRRRDLLDDLKLAEDHVTTPPAFPDVDPATMLEVAAEHGLEGIVAKRADAPYRPGERSSAWIKVPLRPTTEVIIGGWLPGTGRRARTFGALLVGAHDADGRLVWLGNVGTGFTDDMLQLLLSRFGGLERTTSPFAAGVPREFSRVARWVEPVLVADVQYAEVSTDGRLRKPAYKGLRLDKPPETVGVPRA